MHIFSDVGDHREGGRKKEGTQDTVQCGRVVLPLPDNAMLPYEIKINLSLDWTTLFSISLLQQLSNLYHRCHKH